jgi:hypothetical protein
MSDSSTGIAPADARPHRQWPLWQKAAAYLILFLLALFSIWGIDRRAEKLMYTNPATHPFP